MKEPGTGPVPVPVPDFTGGSGTSAKFSSGRVLVGSIRGYPHKCKIVRINISACLIKLNVRENCEECNS